jgi:hypothetical protein
MEQRSSWRLRFCCIRHAGGDDELAREDQVFCYLVIAYKDQRSKTRWYMPDRVGYSDLCGKGTLDVWKKGSTDERNFRILS